MTLEISTAHVNDFIHEMIQPQQSFAEILRHVQQSHTGMALEIEHVGHVLDALNASLATRLKEFADCVGNNFDEVLVDQYVDPYAVLRVGSVYQKSPEVGPSGDPRAARKEAIRDLLVECLSGHGCAGASASSAPTRHAGQ